MKLGHRRARASDGISAIFTGVACVTCVTFAALVTLAAGCKEVEETGGAAAEKKAQEEAIIDLKEPVALISAYRPHLRQPDGKDKYAPKRSSDTEKATICAANEIRHAANGVKQKLERKAASSTKELEIALRDVSVACADATELSAVEKCTASIDALDGTLKKIGDKSAAVGVVGKFPRIAPESITEDAKKAIAPYLKAKGSSAAEMDYLAKRADPAVATGDLIAACQAAAGEAETVAKLFEKADEPIRLVAVTHKMSVDSQCNALNGAEALRRDLNACRKRAKSTECKIVCAKVKTVIDDGVRAAAFTPLEKEHAEICEK